VARGSLDLIKGLGGALLREKIVAAASARLVIIVDAEKLVDRLGQRAPVPVEVTQFGWQATAMALARLGCVPTQRRADGDEPYVTDSGNFILDCRFGPIADPVRLERQLAMTVGVVESGLFVGRASAVVVGGDGGVEILTPPSPRLTGGDAAAAPEPS
jgi:ribose 5-phosphate isomerase A